MKLFLIILLLQILYPENIHRNCLNNTGSRSHGQRHDDLSEVYLSPSEHFMIHYDASGTDAPISGDLNSNNIPDYVERAGIIADSTRQILTEVMGFREEVDDDDGKYDIYILDLGGGLSGVYGYNYIDHTDEITGSSWIEIDNDYSEDIYAVKGLIAMEFTLAHEFFHAIQRAYREELLSNSYFAEFTSMWFEDIIVPNANDYLHFLSSSYFSTSFFSNPEQKLSDTDGYSVALYGHYLSSIVEQVSDQTESTIIRKVWEKFGNGLDPMIALDEVLQEEEYGTSFIDTWVDFCSRNFHNGHFSDMSNDIYYYIDQTSTVINSQNLDLEEVNLNQSYIGYNSLDTLSQLSISQPQTFNLDNNSIELYSINSDSLALLQVQHSPLPNLGKYIVVEKESYDINNVQIEDISISDDIVLNKNNMIHFIYSGDNSTSFIGEPRYYPQTPKISSVSIVDNGIQVIWHPSPSTPTPSYNVYRNSNLIASDLLDTLYIDSSIDSNTNYIYQVSSSTAIGESNLSDGISITSWPDDQNIITTKIISVYPNPVYRPGTSIFNVLVDYGSNIQNVTTKIYDIHGQEILLRDLGSRSQGRFEERLGPLFSENLASGIYFLRFVCDDITLNQKFTILK